MGRGWSAVAGGYKNRCSKRKSIFENLVPAAKIGRKPILLSES